jgi:serine/threonine-protein kinase
VRCLDFGVDHDQPFLVLEYVAGETLADLLARTATLPPEQTLAIVRPVLAALAYVHEQGLVHRDVKPANVLLAQDGTVKLTDFGIAQALAAATQTRTGEVLGSVHYLAPERLTGARATPASDCYAVGVLLYRLLTGRLPFQGDDVAGVIAQQLHHPPSPPSAVRSGLPAWLDQVVLHALAKEPAERYPSAAALLAALNPEPTAPLSATALQAAVRAADQPRGVARTQHLRYRDARRSARDAPSQEPTPPVEPTAPPARPRRRVPAWGWRPAVLGALALVLLAFASQAGSWWSERSAQPSTPHTPVVVVASTPRPTAAPSTPMPATAIPRAAIRATSPPSTRPGNAPLLAVPVQPTPALQGSVGAVRGLVQEVIASGRVTKKRGELQETVGKLERQIPAGEYKEAREQARKLAETVRELVVENQLDPAVAERLLARLTTLQDQLEDLTPRTVREAGPRGR